MLRGQRPHSPADHQAAPGFCSTENSTEQDGTGRHEVVARGQKAHPITL